MLMTIRKYLDFNKSQYRYCSITQTLDGRNTNDQINKLQLYKYTNYNYATIQVYKYTSIQIYKYTNIYYLKRSLLIIIIYRRSV